jgi:Tfp pilus assembly PilM family ATPase
MSRAIDGLEGEPEIVAEAREVLTAGARRIADEIRLSIEYYHSTVPDARRVELTVMAGPGIAIEGLPAFFETELGMPVQPRSMGQVEVEPGALDGVEAAELTVATGLALDKVPN